MKLVGLFYLYRLVLSTILPHHRRKGTIRFEEEKRSEAQGGKHKNGRRTADNSKMKTRYRIDDEKKARRGKHENGRLELQLQTDENTKKED